MPAEIEWVDVDRDLVALQVAEVERHRQRPVQWALKALGIAVLAIVGPPLVTILPRAGVADFLEFLRAEGPQLFGFMAGAVVFVGGAVTWSTWSKEARDVDARVRSIQRSWRRWTGPRWPGWTVLTGLGMALAIGLPVGTLMALDARVDELGVGGRPMLVVMFLGMTCAWTLPVAFFMRWQFMKELRKVVRTPD